MDNQNTQWHDDQVVQVAENGDKIGNQIGMKRLQDALAV
jgi:hypothetical protein